MVLLMEMPTWTWFLIATAASGVAILVLYKLNLIPIPSSWHRSFEDLMRDQITTDELGREEVVRWIKKNHGSETVQVLLVKCTEKYLSKLGYKPPKELDAEHNLLLIMMVKDSDRILKIQLVSCGSMEQKLKDMFKGGDEMLIIDYRELVVLQGNVVRRK